MAQSNDMAVRGFGGMAGGIFVTFDPVRP